MAPTPSPSPPPRKEPPSNGGSSTSLRNGSPTPSFPSQTPLRSKASTSSLMAHSVGSLALSTTSSLPATPLVSKAVPRAMGKVVTGGPTASAGLTAVVSPSPGAHTDGHDDRIWQSAKAKKAEREWKRQNEKALLADPRYRKYTTLIDRGLSSFDSVAEWADFVGALGRLEKIFSGPAPLPTSIIPRSLLLSKRLSQCLNPALPSGVHHRALSVYRQIFVLLSLDGLRRDLAIWTPGLFPFFERANTSTRPVVLSLFEDFYLPLKEDLRPTCRAFLVSVLPGLEEEGAENFERTLRLIDSLQWCVGDELFWSSLWAAIVGNANVRQAAINYLAKRQPSSLTQTTQDCGKDVARLPEAVSSLLASKDLLIVRGGLDLLSQHLPLHSPLYTGLPEEDRVRLMSKAVGILLRRDLSLNRRLWAWMCGSSSPHPNAESEEEDKDAAYFREHGLHTLSRALLEEMTSYGPFESGSNLEQQGESQAFFPSADNLSNRQRPYRIFLALLDKWAVGVFLTSALALDALRAVYWQVQGVASDVATATIKVEPVISSQVGELLTTVGTLFDALDKAILVGCLIDELQDELQGVKQIGKASNHDISDFEPSRRIVQTSQAASTATQIPPSILLEFIFTRFPLKDDISKAVHVPNLASALAVLSAGATHAGATAAPTIARTLALCNRLLTENHLPRPDQSCLQVCAADADASSPDDLLDEVRHFYLQASSGQAPGSQPALVDLQSPRVLSTLLRAILQVSTAVLQGRAPSCLLIPSCDLLTTFMSKLTAAGVPFRVSWQPQAWIQLAVTSIASAGDPFPYQESLIRVVLAAATCEALQPRLTLVQYPVNPFDMPCLPLIDRLIDAIGWDRPSSEHASAVGLLWQVEDISQAGLLQGSFVTGLLSPPSSRPFRRCLEGFATLWRLSDEARLLSGSLALPLFRLLEMLSSDEFARRQVAESWLRSNLRSYTPLLVLLAAAIDSSGATRARRTAHTVVCAKELEVIIFVHQGHFDQEALNHAMSILLALARHGGTGFVKGARTSVVTDSSPRKTHLDYFVDVSLHLLETEVHGTGPGTLHSISDTTHHYCIEFLQILAARGGLSSDRLVHVESGITNQILFRLANGERHPYHQLLLALHTVLVAKAALSTSVLPLPRLLDTIDTALNSTAARPSLAHWVDFILMTVSTYRRALDAYLIPLSGCICGHLANVELWSEAETLLLVNALERAAVLSAHQGHVASNSPRERVEPDTPGDGAFSSPIISLPPPAATAKSTSGGGSSVNVDDEAILQHQQYSRIGDQPSAGTGLLGYVSGIFGNDSQHGAHNPSSRASQSASSVLRSLQLTVTTLHSVWSNKVVTERTRSRTVRVLEKLYNSHPDAVAETIVDCWRGAAQQNTETTALGLLDRLITSPQIIVTFLCDTLSLRLPAPGSSRPTWIPEQIASNDALLGFLEAYLATLRPDQCAGVWPVILVLGKDLLANSAAHKTYLFPALRCFTVLAERMMVDGPRDEDKKARKELLETYLRLFDLCVLIAGKEGREQTGDGAEEKMATASLPLSRAIPAYLAQSALPLLRKLVSGEVDRIASSAANAVYYIVAPPLRTKARSYEDIVDPAVLTLAVEVSSIPGARKALRSCLLEAFFDVKFFRMSAEAGRQWCSPILSALYSQEKSSFLELVSRISVSTTTNINIFSNRRAEQMEKALNLRRLSFVLYAAARDQFLSQLPAIVEKLVDVMKGGVEGGVGTVDGSGSGGKGGDLIRAEAYLCLRVVLCRFHSQHLTTLWPLLITEMTRLLETAIEEPPSDDEIDQLQVLLSACKFLDLLLTIQIEAFQVHQWIFVNDVAWGSDDQLGEPLLPRLADAIQERNREASTSRPRSAPTPAGFGIDLPGGVAPLRRPRLASQRELRSLGDLSLHLQKMSLGSPCGPQANIDWDEIERDLSRDMFADERQ